MYVIASLRNMDGHLVRREELIFADGQVLNYRPRTGPLTGNISASGPSCFENLLSPIDFLPVLTNVSVVENGKPSDL